MFELLILNKLNGKEFIEYCKNPYFLQKRKNSLKYSKKLVLLRVRKVY